MLIFTGIVGFLSACQSEPTPTTQYLTVLHTNDHHGRFWPNDDGEYGMAARKTLIDSLRQDAKDQGHAVLLLSGGDINTGVPESDMLFAEPDFKGMKRLGYDAMAIGNHEFDNPLAILDKQIAWAEFPFLSANIIDKATGKFAYQPYAIFEQGPLTIAVIGLTTVDTAKIGNPEYVSGFDFIEPSQAVENIMPEVNSHAPDFVIALTHMGHFVDGRHGINAPGDVMLARNLSPGTLDAIIGGHSQEPVCMASQNQAVIGYQPGQACSPDKQNGVYIMQAYEWGKYVGKAVFAITGDDVRLASYELLPVNLVDQPGPRIVEDKATREFLKPYFEKGNAAISKPIATISAPLQGERHQVRFHPTNLGKLIAKAQREFVKADVGIISGGGIRASIKGPEVSYKDVLTVHPFKNRITYVDFTGKELTEYLSTVLAFPSDSGAYAQFHGVSFDLNNGKVANLKVAGKNLIATNTYRLSINSYNAAGGDGYPKLTDHPKFTAVDVTDAEILKRYLEAKGHLDVSTLNQQ